MGVRLPAEYQEVEYVQATGTQAFFTDVPIQDGLTVDSVQTFAMGDNYLFGGNNGNVQICFNGTYNSRLQSSYNGYYYWTGGFDVQTNNTTKYHVVQTQRNGSQIGFLDDVQILNGTRSTTKDTSAGKTAALFGQRNASGVLNAFYKGKLYSCKVSKDGTLLADFVPCYRKADGEIGMYDLVLQKFYVNEGTGVFLKGADVIDSISPLMVAWRRIMMAAASVAKKLVKLIATSTSGLVSFDTNVEMPTKVTCEFSPIQEGTGDPSPDNVRPISGWTGATITDGSGNLLKMPVGTASGFGITAVSDGENLTLTGTVTTTYVWIALSSNNLALFSAFTGMRNLARAEPEFLKENVKYRMSSFKVSGNTSVSPSHVYYFYKDGTNGDAPFNSAFTPTKPVSLILIRFVKDNVLDQTYKYSLTIGQNVQSEWEEPKTQQLLPINWQSEAGTVYCGTVTLNEDGSADLTVTSLSIEFDGSADEAWKFETTANHYKNAYIAMPSTFKTLQTTSTEMICSASPTSATKSGTIYRAEKDACYISSGKNFNFCWLDTLEIFNANDFKAWLQDGHSLQVVATLINPITYHFDNIAQLNSFLGQNNIWHNMNGSITAEYYKKQ